MQREGELDAEKQELYRQRFIEAVGNDLNTSSGLTVLYDMLKADMNDATKRAIAEDFEKVLSLGLTEAKETAEPQDEELTAYRGTRGSEKSEGFCESRCDSGRAAGEGHRSQRYSRGDAVAEGLR